MSPPLVVVHAFTVGNSECNTTPRVVGGGGSGCGGGSSWFRGLGRQPHTDACRRRLEGLMKEDAKVKNAKRRGEEFREKMKKKEELYKM